MSEEFIENFIGERQWFSREELLSSAELNELDEFSDALLLVCRVAKVLYSAETVRNVLMMMAGNESVLYDHKVYDGVATTGNDPPLLLLGRGLERGSATCTQLAVAEARFHIPPDSHLPIPGFCFVARQLTPLREIEAVGDQCFNFECDATSLDPYTNTEVYTQLLCNQGVFLSYRMLIFPLVELYVNPDLPLFCFNPERHELPKHTRTYWKGHEASHWLLADIPLLAHTPRWPMCTGNAAAAEAHPQLHLVVSLCCQFLDRTDLVNLRRTSKGLRETVDKFASTLTAAVFHPCMIGGDPLFHYSTSFIRLSCTLDADYYIQSLVLNVNGIVMSVVLPKQIQQKRLRKPFVD